VPRRNKVEHGFLSKLRTLLDLGTPVVAVAGDRKLVASGWFICPGKEHELRNQVVKSTTRIVQGVAEDETPGESVSGQVVWLRKEQARGERVRLVDFIANEGLGAHWAKKVRASFESASRCCSAQASFA
jgi:hypothetical protein